jgi:peptidoglycan/xylan/chitin deacetylase (PgdA/CDA1 family)
MSLYKTMHKLASPVLYQSGLYQRLWRARGLREPFSFVVFYHRVVPDQPVNGSVFDIEKGISASAFELQMRFLRRHFKPVKASRIQSELGPEIGFAVTLDDGYEDNYRVAAPILKKLGIPATFYVVSDFVGSDRLFWWEQIADLMRRSARPELDLQAVITGCAADGKTRCLPMLSDVERGRAYEQLCAGIRRGRHAEIPLRLRCAAEYLEVPLREHGRDYALMDWEQLNDLVRQGFEIGGHSATHCNVVDADEALLRRELIESLDHLEAKLDAPVESFAYPYGLFDASSDLVSDLLANTNCKVAYTVAQGVVSAASPAYELPRTRLNRPYNFACAFNVQDTLNTAAGPGQASAG